MRKYASGGIRDNEEGKMDLEGYLSPLVIKSYGEYMLKNQQLPDGSTRGSDNWQQGFGDNHLDVCIKSKMRHDHDLWLNHRGFPEQARSDSIEACNAILFNTSAYLHQLLIDKMQRHEGGQLVELTPEQFKELGLS